MASTSYINGMKPAQQVNIFKYGPDSISIKFINAQISLERILKASKTIGFTQCDAYLLMIITYLQTRK